MILMMTGGIATSLYIRQAKQGNEKD